MPTIPKLLNYVKKVLRFDVVIKVEILRTKVIFAFVFEDDSVSHIIGSTIQATLTITASIYNFSKLKLILRNEYL